MSYLENTMANKVIDKKKEGKQIEENDIYEKIIEYLSQLSSQLKKTKDRDKKINSLVELNEFLKKYGEIIEKLCPEKLVSILNSL